MKTDIFYKIENDTIGIRADPAIIDDLIMVLESLLSIAQTVKTKAKIRQAELRAKDESLRAQREAEYSKEAARVYRRYKEHLNNGCMGDKSLAVKKTYQELGILRIDAEFYIAEGKRMEKRLVRELFGMA